MSKRTIINRIKCWLEFHSWLYYHKECIRGECRHCGKPVNHEYKQIPDGIEGKRIT